MSNKATPTSLSTSKRRRFQIPITSYFQTTEQQCDENVSHNNYSAPTYSPTPTLPHKVQSSLLNVGMRVRKSVPEGYKNTPSKTNPSVSPKPKATASTTMTADESSFETHGSVSCGGRRSYTELEPFCGIHKVGGYAVQEFPQPVDAINTMGQLTDDQWDMETLPPSSQESNSSTYTYNSHKRTFEQQESDSEEDAFSAAVNISNDGIGEISALPPAVYSPQNTSSRTILFPKARNKGGHVSRQERRQILESSSQNKMLFRGQKSHSPAPEFEDAIFLRRKEEVDDEYIVREVEMGGI